MWACFGLFTKNLPCTRIWAISISSLFAYLWPSRPEPWLFGKPLRPPWWFQGPFWLSSSFDKLNQALQVPHLACISTRGFGLLIWAYKLIPYAYSYCSSLFCVLLTYFHLVLFSGSVCFSFLISFLAYLDDYWAFKLSLSLFAIFKKFSFIKVMYFCC